MDGGCSIERGMVMGGGRHTKFQNFNLAAKIYHIILNGYKIMPQHQKTPLSTHLIEHFTLLSRWNLPPTNQEVFKPHGFCQH